jgi:hypothetical protein
MLAFSGAFLQSYGLFFRLYHSRISTITSPLGSLTSHPSSLLCFLFFVSEAFLHFRYLRRIPRPLFRARLQLLRNYKIRLRRFTSTPLLAFSPNL